MRVSLLATICPLVLLIAARAVSQHPVKPSPLAMGFTRNDGQWDERVSFVWRGAGGTLWLERDGFSVVEMRARNGDLADMVATRVTFSSCDAAMRVVPSEPLQSCTNYLVGDPKNWRTNVGSYAQVEYQGIQPGVRLRFRDEGGGLRWELDAVEGSSLDAFSVRLQGVDPAGRSGIDARTGLTKVLQPLRSRESPVRPASSGSAGAAGGPGPNHFVGWGTYLGGSAWETCADVAVTPTGEIVVAGYTWSLDFPTTAGAYSRQLWGVHDAFVVRLTADCSRLVFATFLGGQYGDHINTLAVAPLGEVTVAGETFSPDFPTTSGAFDRLPPATPWDRVFVARLTASGSALVFSTFIGGNGGSEFVHDVALYPDGSPLIVGFSGHGPWPTTAGAYKQAHDVSDAFITRLNPSGTALVASTLLDAHGFFSSFAWVNAVAIDPQGRVVVTGRTKRATATFPTTQGAYRRSYSGGEHDVFVARLDPMLTTLEASTLLGGSDSESTVSVALSATGSVVVAGYTTSKDFPTTPGVIGPHMSGRVNGFTTRLNAALTALECSSYLTPDGAYVSAYWMDIDSADCVHVVGLAEAKSNLQTTKGARDRVVDGMRDVCVIKLDAKLTQYRYAGFVGGSGGEFTTKAALTPSGGLVLAGATDSVDFPVTWNAVQTRYAGGQSDAFVAVEELLPSGVGRYGNSTTACRGNIAIGVTSIPEAGSQSFAFTCHGVRPSWPGCLMLGTQNDYPGTIFLGARLHVSPWSPALFPIVISDGLGSTELNMPISAGMQGQRFFAQFIWPMEHTCSTTQRLSASNALDIVVQ